MLNINVSIFHETANNSIPNDSTCVVFANFKSKHILDIEGIWSNALNKSKHPFYISNMF